ncbi:hypothetical protein D3C80_946210 [compost metagenome]
MEQPIYGADRLGTFFVQGSIRRYELKDHMGNVRGLLLRSKNGINADIYSFKDYYAFGSKAQSGGTDDYRYDYQGEYAEKAKETDWNAYDLRMYDAKIGRWLSVDPKNQYWSPYVGMGNNPVSRTDPDGGLDGWYNDENGNATFNKDVNSQGDLATLGIKGSYIGQSFSGHDKNGYGIAGDKFGNLSMSLPEVEVSTQRDFWRNATKNNPYMPTQFFDGIGIQVTFSASTYFGTYNYTAGLYLDNYGFRGFVNTGLGFGAHTPGFGVTPSVFGVNYNSSRIPDPDNAFAGNSVASAFGAGPISFSIAQSSKDKNPFIDIPSCTVYTFGRNLISSYSFETNISRTFLMGFDFHDRHLKQ